MRREVQDLAVSWKKETQSFFCFFFQYGLNMMLKSEDGLLLMARSMDPDYTNMMADVVKVMAAVCLVK